MAVSRFLNVDYSQPISSFVPRPFEAALMAGKQAQDQYETGQKISGEIDKLEAALKVIPHDEPAKQQMLSEYKSAIKQTADKYKNNYSSSDFQNEASNIVNLFKNDSRLSVFTNNIERYKELNENLKDPNKSRDIHHLYGEFFNPDKSIKYNDPNNPHAFGPITTTKAGDRPKTLNEIFQGVTEDGTPTSRISQTAHTVGEKMYYIDYKGERKEISKDKISNVAYANLDNYLSTEAGTHELRSSLENLKGQGILPQDFNTYNVNSENYKSILGSIATGNKRKSPVYDKQGKKTGEQEYDESLAEYLRDDIVDNIFAGGRKFIHRMETGQYDRSGAFDPYSDYSRKKADEMSEIRPVYETGEIDVKGNTYDFSNVSLSPTDFTKAKGAINPLSDPNINYLESSKKDQTGHNKIVMLPSKLGEKELKLIDNMMSLRSKKEQDAWNVTKNNLAKLKPTKYGRDNSALYQKTADYLDNIYTQAKVLADKAVGDIRSNMSVQGLSGQDVKELNNIFGGKVSGDMKVNDLTTGIGTNSFIYDPSTGETKTMQTFIDDQSGMFKTSKDAIGSMPVRLSGKLDPKNHITSLTGKAGFADGLQVVINGKPYYITGPDRYIDSRGNAVPEKQEQKAFKQTVNRLYQLQLTPELIGEDNILGTKVKTAYNRATGTFVVEPQENISFKSNNTTYNIDVKDRGFQGKTPEEAIAEYNLFVKQQAQSLAPKK